MDPIRGIVLLAAFFFLGQVLWYTARNRLRDRQAFFWLLLAAAGILTALGIPLLNRLAVAVGVAYMPALVFLAAVIAALSILMRQAAELSAHQDKLQTVLQELACMQKEIDDLKAAGRPEKEVRMDDAV